MTEKSILLSDLLICEFFLNTDKNHNLNSAQPVEIMNSNSLHILNDTKSVLNVNENENFIILSEQYLKEILFKNLNNNNINDNDNDHIQRKTTQLDIIKDKKEIGNKKFIFAYAI